MGTNFELLKRTYPVSEFDRICDGYQYILDNTTPRQRRKWGIVKKRLRLTIKKSEKYIYQVAKEDNEFKTMCLNFDNYRIIRKYIYGINDDDPMIQNQ
jgi:hypothetical protein